MNFSYPILDDAFARTLLSQFRDQGPTSYQGGVGNVIGDGPNIIENVDFESLHDQLRDLWDNCTGIKSTEFESKGGLIVHKHLQDLNPIVSTDNRFWLWLTFVSAHGKFFNIVRDRMGSFQEPNYGLASLSECLYFRLWWRGFRFSDDNYDLALRGSAEFWRSHIIRIEYAYGDTMARAFIKFNYPQKGQTSGGDTEFIRDLAKKLTARHASCAFETLTEDECTEILNEISEFIPKKSKKSKSGSTE